MKRSLLFFGLFLFAVSVFALKMPEEEELPIYVSNECGEPIEFVIFGQEGRLVIPLQPFTKRPEDRTRLLEYIKKIRDQGMVIHVTVDDDRCKHL